MNERIPVEYGVYKNTRWSHSFAACCEGLPRGGAPVGRSRSPQTARAAAAAPSGDAVLTVGRLLTPPPEAESRGGIRWRWSRFPDLSAHDVYEMLALRSRVFVVEQDCVFHDPDGRDPDAWHLLAWRRVEEGREELVGYARVFAPGAHYEEMSIGRIVSAPEVRGSGVGRMIVNEAMRFCAERWPEQPIRIAAQNRLERFYREFGFVADGKPYIHDGIDHLDMLGRSS